jgi:hypothetical protein
MTPTLRHLAAVGENMRMRRVAHNFAASMADSWSIIVEFIIHTEHFQQKMEKKNKAPNHNPRYHTLTRLMMVEILREENCWQQQKAL